MLERKRPFGSTTERCFAITISMTGEQHDYLDDLAERYGMRKSHFCYQLVRDGIEQQLGFHNPILD